MALKFGKVFLGSYYLYVKVGRFSGKNHLKFRNFVNFSGKCHKKIGYFYNFSGKNHVKLGHFYFFRTYFSDKNVLPPKVH